MVTLSKFCPDTGQITVKVDIHSVGQPNGHASSVTPGTSKALHKPSAKLPASSAKAVHTNGTMSKGMPSKGKPGAAKTAQKRDPAEVQRERQLAEEEEVSKANICILAVYGIAKQQAADNC